MLVPDPANPPQLVVLTGYLARSSDPAYQRIYLDLAFRSFVDFEIDGLVHAVHTHSDADPTGPSTVWVREEAALRPDEPQEQIAASLFEGEVVQRHFAGAAPAAAEPLAASTWPCGISLALCPTTGCLPTPRCTLGSVCTATPRCEPSTPRCPTPPTMRWCTQRGPC